MSKISQQISRRSILLLLMDALAVVVAYSVASYLRAGHLLFGSSHLPPFLYISLVVFPLCFYSFDLYYPYKYFHRTQTFVDVGLSVAIGVLIMASLAYFDRSFILARYMFAIAAVATFIFVYLLRLFYDFIFRSRLLDRKTLVIGTGPLAADLIRKIVGTPHSGMEIVGVVAEKKKTPPKRLGKVPVVGEAGDLLSLIEWYGAQLIILALDKSEKTSEMAVISGVLEKQVWVTSGMHLYENLTGEVPYQLIDEHYLLSLMAKTKSNLYLKIKRMVDISGALALFIVLQPLFLLGIFLSAVENKGKIFFVQKRIGMNAQPFFLVKFRSMRNIPGRPKITRLGRWLRRHRIDEIPQLLNVFKGDMSLVGPRPEMPRFVTRCRKEIPFYDAVFSVKPGLTGWAQIKFRHTQSRKEYNRKFRYNLYYLKNLSLKLDLMILLQTIRIVILGRGK